MVMLYVEGGGQGCFSKALQIECRRAFREFLEKAGLAGHMPRISACGGRQNAYESFCTAAQNDEDAVLLVDSEAPVDAGRQQGDSDTWQPWQHLRERPGDGWTKPPGTADTDCHLMVQCTESWFLADRSALAAFFGQEFRERRLPAAAADIESIAKSEVYRSLAGATQDCTTKGQYNKGEHSFKLLALIDPGKVSQASPWAKRLVEELKKKMEVS